MPLEQIISTVNKEQNKTEQKAKSTQKLRSDRLAKKELRIKEMQSRYARLRKAEKLQMKLQRKIARTLQKKRREDLMSSQEYRAMYGRPNTQNDGNILHTQSHFMSNDARERSVQTNSHILAAENVLLRQRNITSSSPMPQPSQHPNILNAQKMFFNNPRVSRIHTKNKSVKYTFL